MRRRLGRSWGEEQGEKKGRAEEGEMGSSLASAPAPWQLGSVGTSEGNFPPEGAGVFGPLSAWLRFL